MTFEELVVAVHDWTRRLPPAQVCRAVKRQLESAEGVDGFRRGISSEAVLVMVHMGLAPGMVPVAPRRIASEPASKPEPKAAECAPRREWRGRPSKRALVREQLAKGPKRGEDVQAAGEAADFTERTLIAAASALGVRTRKGQWWIPG